MNTLKRVRAASLLLPRYCIVTVFFDGKSWPSLGCTEPEPLGLGRLGLGQCLLGSMLIFVTSKKNLTKTETTETD